VGEDLSRLAYIDIRYLTDRRNVIYLREAISLARSIEQESVVLELPTS